MTKKQNKVDKLLGDLDVESILQRAVQSSLTQNSPLVVEGYVAQPKQYGQVTETVSAKTKASHKEFYEELIKSLNRTAAEADTVDKNDVDELHCAYRSVKTDEARLLNAVWLHELFFANCFDPNSTLYEDSLAYMKLQKQWGTFDAFQADFMASAMACSEGFAVCGYNFYLKQYVVTFVTDYSKDVMLGLFPILVVDMHHHAMMDYYNDRRSYVVSMLREVNWDCVEERVKKSETIAGALR